jgi:DNA-binding transcriptional ArsR family regulator
MDPTRAEILTRTLSAVADPVRRAVLQRLAHGPATTGQLAALFPISRAAVSQHLRVLREAGLVRSTSPSRQSPYELAPGPLVETEAWLRRLVDVRSSGPTARSAVRSARLGGAP